MSLAAEENVQPLLSPTMETGTEGERERPPHVDPDNPDLNPDVDPDLDPDRDPNLNPDVKPDEEQPETTEE